MNQPERAAFDPGGRIHRKCEVQGNACRNTDPGQAERDEIEQGPEPVLPGNGLYRLLICPAVQESILMCCVAPEQIKADRQQYECPIILHLCAYLSLQVSPVHTDIVIFSSSVYTETL